MSHAPHEKKWFQLSSIRDQKKLKKVKRNHYKFITMSIRNLIRKMHYKLHHEWMLRG